MTGAPPEGPLYSDIPRVEHVPVEVFRTEYEERALPLIITGAVSHWPAMTKWSHEWFKATHGSVQVELSVNPTHTRKVVAKRLRDYIDLILANKQMAGGLYLDQYPLDSIPTLWRDVVMPPYCPRDRRITANLWLGPSTTVLSFHKDNHWSFDGLNNIFVQVRGRKRIVLAGPDQDEFMYPRPREVGAYWHSSIQLKNVDFVRFPLFRRAKLLEGIVNPGDIIFIPRYYWHYVEALEKSISLSFWWRPSRLAERLVDMIQNAENGTIGDIPASPMADTIAHQDLEEFGGSQAVTAALQELAPAIAERVARYLKQLIQSEISA